MQGSSPFADGAKERPRHGERRDLVVHDLSVSYGHVTALKGVTLELPQGSSGALIGSNGAGKSTLIRAIGGGLRIHGGRVSRGSITYGGRSIVGVDSADLARRGIVHVPEGRRVFTRMTVWENLEVAAQVVRSPQRRQQLEAEVAEMFPVLADRRHQKAGLLSGGEQQMLAIGRGLMMDPSLLMLDEPSLGLAPTIVDRIADAIRGIMERDLSLLLVEQNAAIALELAADAHVLETGVVAMQGPSAEIAGSTKVRELYLGVGREGTSVGQPDVGTLSRWQA